MKSILLAILAVLTCWSETIQASTDPWYAARPNIVVIMADDLGLGDLGCYQCLVPGPHEPISGQETFKKMYLRLKEFVNWVDASSKLLKSQKDELKACFEQAMKPYPPASSRST